MPVDELVAENAEEVAAEGIEDAAEEHGEAEGLDDASTADDADTAEEDGEESEEDGTEEEQPIVAGNGRKMTDALKKGFAELKRIDPAAAKAMKGTYFAEQEYRSVFALPADAVAAKSLIDQVGGTEGIQQIEAERQEWNEIDRAFAEGKPEFVKGLAENNPEAFSRIAPQVINEFAARSPEQYEYYRNAVAVNTILQQPGVESSLQTLAQLHGQLADAPWAQKAIADVVNGIVGLKEKATQFEQKRVDPERSKLEQDKQSFEQQKRADFETGIADKADAYLAEKMPAAIASVVNGRKVDPEAMKGFERLVKDKLQELRAAVPNYKANLEAHYRSGNAKAAQDYIKGHDDRLMPEAAKVIAPFLRNIPATVEPVGGRKPAAGGARSTPQAGEITLKEQPSWDQLDPVWRARPEATAEVIQGRAVLKSGKKASGWA